MIIEKEAKNVCFNEVVQCLGNETHALPKETIGKFKDKFLLAPVDSSEHTMKFFLTKKAKPAEVEDPQSGEKWYVMGESDIFFISVISKDQKGVLTALTLDNKAWVIFLKVSGKTTEDCSQERYWKVFHETFPTRNKTGTA